MVLSPTIHFAFPKYFATECENILQKTPHFGFLLGEKWRVGRMFWKTFFKILVYSIAVVPIFPPLSSSAQPNPLSHSHPHAIVHVHGSLIHVLWLIPSPSSHHYPLSTSPLVTVSLFRVSVPLVIFCLLVYFCSLGSSYRRGIFHLYLYKVIGSYFIETFIICYLFWCHIVPDLASRSPFKLVSVSFWHVSIIVSYILSSSFTFCMPLYILVHLGLSLP